MSPRVGAGAHRRVGRSRKEVGIKLPRQAGAWGHLRGGRLKWMLRVV